MGHGGGRGRVGGTQLERRTRTANGEKEAGAEAKDTEAGAMTGKRARGSESRCN